MLVPASFTWAGVTVFTAALVPQKMKAGVSNAPWGVSYRPVRARLPPESRAVIWKEKPG